MSVNRLSFVMRMACLSAALALPLMGNAGEITRPDQTKPFKWKSTECLLPLEPVAKPGISVEQRLTKYARDIELYIDCIQREAQRDFEKTQRDLQAAIERDLERQTEIMNGMMLQAARSMR